MKSNRRAGPITLAVGLIFFGLVMLISNLTGIGLLASVFKFWPILLMALGIEYFIKSYISKKKNEDEGARFHFPTVIIILLVTFIGFCGQQAAGLLQNRELAGLINEAIAGNAFSYTHQFTSKPVKPGLTKVRAEEHKGNFDIRPSSDGMLHVNASIVGWGPSEVDAKKRAEFVKINISEGSVINISRGHDRSFQGRRQADIKYRLEIPDGVDIEIENGLGDIKANNLASNILIDNQNGDVSLTDIKGNVVVNGENGQLSCRSIYGNVDVRMRTGDIEIFEPYKDVRVTNRNGRIELSGSKTLDSNYNIINRNGEIVCRIPEESNVKISAQLDTGSIGGSLGLRAERLPEPGGSGDVTRGTAVLGNGEGSINIFNRNGNIVLDKF